MAILKLNSTIVDNETKVWMAWDGFEGITFEDVKKFISEIPEEDPNIDLQINCAGGDCVEGWAIYDALRQSGKVITAVIEGQCSSMASVILLAAPKENRKAYANAHLCIHNPEACWLNVDYYMRLTADNIEAMTDAMQKQAQSLREEQQKILNLYVERTGTDAETLQALMNDDIYVGMTKAKELGFISETLAPNTASKKSFFNSLIKPQQMAKTSENKSAIAKAFAALGAALGITDEPAKMQSLTLTTTTGDELVVEREEGDPQVGDAASPDGTFVLDDGSTIVVEDGVITSITKEDDNSGNKAVITNPSTGEELTEEQAQQLINDLTAKVAELEEKLAQADNDKAAKDAQIADLQSKQISDEQNEIFATVASKGGKEWLAAVSATGQANGFHKQEPQQNLGSSNEPQAKIGEGFLKAHTAKRFGRRAVTE